MVGLVMTRVANGPGAGQVTSRLEVETVAAPVVSTSGAPTRGLHMGG